MQNLIMNSQWAPGPGGGPQFFSAIGPVTYDNLSINGYRSCSISMMPSTMGIMMAQDFYDPLINVRGRNNISWGFTIRVVDANYIALVADFFDRNMNLIRSFENPITREVTYQFKPIISNFRVPTGAENVRLSIKFIGKITACTYNAPVAFYS